MDILNPKLEYKTFLDLSRRDIKAAKLLNDSGDYITAIYHFQQSVEKSCKAIGLIIGAVEYNQLKKIGHNPKKVFEHILNNEIFNELGGTEAYTYLESEIDKYSTFEEKVKMICETIFQVINTNELIKIEQGQLPSEAIINYFENNPFKGSFPIDLKAAFNGHIGEKECETITKEEIDRINRNEKVVASQIYMSFLVDKLEANTRYADHSGEIPTTPDNRYAKNSFFVQSLRPLINLQENAIDEIEDYFFS